MEQNCTEKTNFKYHCVLNEWGNRTVEVCAPETHIIGAACAEFNTGGQFIQEHYRSGVKCTTCPFLYMSTEAYKYKECYMNILLDDMQSTIPSIYFNDSVTTAAPTSMAQK
ncbi:uncharacterized protein LOC134233137 [Saccostrea cucullata]|uniref:uncharacterized protein LOC134233137 n=1 Tax=Saccostrea cuccullata TaxID=36930 RepID=UPI002ED1CBAC